MRRTHAITAAAALIIAICLCALAQAQEDLVRRGVSLMNALQFQEAERTFRSAILKYPAAVVPRLFLGFILLHRNALSEAEQNFTQSLRADPENTTARLGLGMTLLQQGLPARAEEEFAKIRQNPDVSRSAQALHVRSLLLLGREDEALAEARRLADSYPSDAGYRRTVGTLCQMRGKQDEALDAFIQAVERDPFHVQTYLSIIAIYRLEENWTEAQQWSARALEIDQNHPLIYEELALACDRLGLSAAAEKAREDGRRTLQAEQLYNRAVKARAAGSAGEAEELLQRCVTENPRLAKAWIDLGDIHRGRKEFEQARRYLDRAVEAEPWNSRALTAQAALYRAEGNDRRALEIYHTALSRQLANPDLLSGLAAAYLKQGQNEKAAETMLQAVARLPDNPDLLSYLGFLEELQGNRRDARNAYADALRMNPGQLDAMLGLARTQLASGEIRESAETFRKAAAADPSSGEAWRGLIEAYRRAGDASGARSASRACLARIPSDPGCREQLASVELDLGEYRDAAGNFEILLRHGRSSREILNGLAFALAQSGDFARAAPLLEEALEKFGPDSWAYSTLGYVSRGRGDRQAAIRHYRSALDLSPGNPDRIQDLGFALYLAGKYGEAAAQFETALRLRPGWGRAHFNLAMSYWQLRQYGPALMHAKAAREKGIPEADWVVARLSRGR